MRGRLCPASSECYCLQAWCDTDNDHSFADYIFGLNILRSTYILFDNSGRDPLVGFAPVKPAAVNPCKQPPGNLATGKALTQLTSSV